MRGFVYEDGNAYAVYHAMLQTEHPSTIVDLALSFGSWSDQATGADRIRIDIRVWPVEDELKMHIDEPAESAWGDSGTFGRMAGRGEVLGTPFQEEAMRTAEFVVSHDSRIEEHLRG